MLFKYSCSLAFGPRTGSSVFPSVGGPNSLGTKSWTPACLAALAMFDCVSIPVAPRVEMTTSMPARAASSESADPKSTSLSVAPVGTDRSVRARTVNLRDSRRNSSASTIDPRPPGPTRAIDVNDMAEQRSNQPDCSSKTAENLTYTWIARVWSV